MSERFIIVAQLEAGTCTNIIIVDKTKNDEDNDADDSGDDDIDPNDHDSDENGVDNTDDDDDDGWVKIALTGLTMDVVRNTQHENFIKRIPLPSILINIHISLQANEV